MKWFYVGLVILFFASCNETGDKRERRRIGDMLIESTFINDTTYHGLTKYYSLSNVLEGETEFKNGVKNGFSKNYYSNGLVHDSMTFVNGLTHGYHFVYDSTGRLEYKDFFYQGRKVGGLFFYNNGKIAEYDFLSFDEELLFKAKYDDMESISEFGGQIINEHISSKIVGNSQENLLFLYTINPPNVTIKYSIGVFDSMTKDRSLFKTIPFSQNMFVEVPLPKVREKASYFIQADYADSLNKFYKVHIKPFQF